MSPIMAIFIDSFSKPKLSCSFFAKKIKNIGVMAKNRFQTKKKPREVPVLYTLISSKREHNAIKINTLMVGLLGFKFIIEMLKSTLCFKVKIYFPPFKILC